MAAPQFSKSWFCLNTDRAVKMAADPTRSQGVIPPTDVMEPLDKLVRTKMHWISVTK